VNHISVRQSAGAGRGWSRIHRSPPDLVVPRCRRTVLSPRLGPSLWLNRLPSTASLSGSSRPSRLRNTPDFFQQRNGRPRPPPAALCQSGSVSHRSEVAAAGVRGRRQPTDPRAAGPASHIPAGAAATVEHRAGPAAEPASLRTTAMGKVNGSPSHPRSCQQPGRHRVPQ
jgi:hypothetical protein